MNIETKNALGEGLVDALGFVAGAMAGGLIARAFGLDFLTEEGWGTGSIGGILLVGLGAGLGKTMARKLLRREAIPTPSSAATSASTPAPKKTKGRKP
jgi:sugar (pentulose or hexulose) kinase